MSKCDQFPLAIGEVYQINRLLHAIHDPKDGIIFLVTEENKAWYIKCNNVYCDS